MSARDVSDQEVKVDLMNRLFRKHCWSTKYLPLDTLKRWISKRIRDGKRLDRLVRELVNEDYLLLHKGGKTVSLNPRRSKEILEYIRRFIA